ncbi:hypothetical protein E9993_15435 [Labilibacter sediminis]|nr:hypothetical protein E9993_15435 [Labilibacter sediminis]
MKKIKSLILMFLALSTFCFAQETQTEQKDTKEETKETKKETEEKQDTKNVMLNAESNQGPRVINVGLPGMDLSIYEDGLPVVPYFWPQNPLTIWRYDQSIQRINLASFSENALIAGKTGYLIDTYSRQGGRKFRGYASLRTNVFGFYNGELNLSGPIKNDWYYSVSANYADDPGYRKSIPDINSTNLLLKGFITKKFKNKKGELLFGVKHDYANGNNNVYVPFIYKKGGDYEQVEGFDVLRDSYFPRDTKVNALNRLDGTESEVDMANSMITKTFAYDFGVKYNFDNGWKLNFRNRLHKADVSISVVRPLGGAFESANIKDELRIQGPFPINLTYADDGSIFDNPNGLVQMTAHSYNNPMDYTTFSSRFEMTKKQGNHSYRIGSMFMYENQDEFVTNNTVFLHEVAPDPRKIDLTLLLPPAYGGPNKITDNGQLPHNGTFSYIDGSRSDIGVYFSDKWEVSPVFTLGYGGRLNYRWYDAWSADSETPLDLKNGETIKDRELRHVDDEIMYWQGYINGEYKLSKLTGFLFEATKNEITPILNEFSISTVSTEKRQPIYSAKFGVFYNHPKINVVSSIDYITKKNDLQPMGILIPGGQGQKENFKIYHDLETMGWVTDVIVKPFKNFELHTMFTLQKPKYDNFEFETSWGESFNFNGKVPGGISEVLVEIDPSAYFLKRKLKAWASFRYFSKQYASFSNLLYYKPRWESFAGLDYKFSRKLSAEIKVYNLANFAGMKGSIQNDTQYNEGNLDTIYGTPQSGETMLPRHAELKISYKF